MSHNFSSPDIIIGLIVLGFLVLLCVASILISQEKLYKKILIVRKISNAFVITWAYLYSYVIRRWSAFTESDEKQINGRVDESDVL